MIMHVESLPKIHTHTHTTHTHTHSICVLAWCGPDTTASMLTPESAGLAPHWSAWYGVHNGAASSASATHMVNFMGVPRVVDSVPTVR